MEAIRLTSESPNENNQFDHPHVGEILLEQFLKPMALSQNALAHAISVSPCRINEIVPGKRAITTDTDLRLARYFGMSDGFYLRLQLDCDLRQYRKKMAAILDATRPRAL